jgi:hypothetical protein
MEYGLSPGILNDTMFWDILNWVLVLGAAIAFVAYWRLRHRPLNWLSCMLGIPLIFGVVMAENRPFIDIVMPACVASATLSLVNFMCIRLIPKSGKPHV